MEFREGKTQYKWYGRHVGDYCFDDETNVMTETRGLVRFAELEPGESVMTLNTQSGLIEFQRAHVVQNAYNGPLVHLHGKALDQAVTPSHRVLVKRKESRVGRRRPPLTFRHAEVFSGRGNYGLMYAVPRAGAWVGADPSQVLIDPVPKHAKAMQDRLEAEAMYRDGAAVKSIAAKVGRNESLIGSWVRGHKPMRSSGKAIAFDAGDWMEFVGWWVTEGGVAKAHNYRVHIWQSASANPEKCDRIAALLQRMGLRSQRNEEGFVIHSRQLYEHLAPLGKQRDKRLPAYAKAMSPRLLQRLIDAMLLGDGSEMRRLYTGSDQLRDDFIEVALKCGYGCTYRIGGCAATPVWDVCISRRTAYHRISHVDTIAYDGMVYCVTVPNGTVMVERNGKLCWSGNSLPEGFTADELGHCEHAIGVPGNPNAYEIGVVKRKDGKPGFQLIWDFWNGGKGLEALAGANCNKLRQAYTIEAAKRAAQKQGFRVTGERKLDNGSVQLVLAK